MIVRSDDGVVLDLLRYGAVSIAAPQSIVSASLSNQSWFWECQFKRDQLDSGERLVMLATGLSTAEGFMSYGTELMALFNAAADLILAYNQSATLEVLYLPMPTAASSNAVPHEGPGHRPVSDRSADAPAIALQSAPGTSTAAIPEPVAVDGWYPDPAGQHHYRYFAAGEWTDSISTNGTVGTSPLTHVRWG